MNANMVALVGALAASTAVTAPLAAGTAGIFDGMAPQGSAYPLVIVQEMADTEDNETMHRSRQVVTLIKAVSTRHMAEAGTIAAAVEATLHGVHLSVTGWTNFWTVRESAVSYPEVAADRVAYFHQGGIYRQRLTQ